MLKQKGKQAKIFSTIGNIEEREKYEHG